MLNRRLASLSVAVGCVFSFAAFGQSQQTLPPAFDSVAGSLSNSMPLGNFSSGTYQVMYGADQMTAIPVGSVITGMQLRMNNSATTNFPSSSVSLSQYDIRLATSNLTPSSMSSTYATNMVSPVLVRSGGFTIGSNFYSGTAATGTTPEPWGGLIPFSTNYTYLGGPLVIEFRVTSPSNTGLHYADIVGGGTANRYMFTDNNSSATTGGSPAPGGLVVRLTFTPAFAPLQSGVTKLVVLGDTTTTRGSATTTSFLNLSPRTLQTTLDATELRGLAPGSRFVGLGLRGGTSAAWPAAAQSFSKYDIQLSKSNNAPGAMSDTVAANIGADAVTVRSGALAVAANSLLPWPASPGYAPWSLEIPFTTPYMYVNGPLHTVIRSDGVTGPLAGELDAIATSSPLYGTRLKARLSAASSTATTTTSASAYPLERWSIDAGVAVPNSNAAAAGNASSTAALRPEAITYQAIVSASELTYLPIGSQITGFSLRMDSGVATYPASAALFSDYQVFVSTSRRHPNDASLTFALNEGADMVQVRSGSLAIPAGMFPGGGTVNPFASPIWFQRPFVYRGGDLCMTVRHSGAPGSLLPVFDGSSDTTRTITRSNFGMNSTTGDSDLRFGPVIRFAYNPSVVAPVGSTTTPGNIGYTLMFSAAGNVYQAIYREDQLRGVRIGSVITGLSLRSGGFNTWPGTDTNINRFDVTVSTSPRQPSAMSNTFADNIGADAVLVRSGPMTIPAGAFPYASGGSRPNDNAWYIQFTRPFVYNGGPLSLTIRNDSAAQSSFFFDVLDNVSDAANGRWAYGTGADATVSNRPLFGALISRFAFVPRSFCPADLNNDGIVEDADFSLFVVAYDALDCADPVMSLGCPADLNHDGVVDDADFSPFVVAYNELLCP